MERRYVDVLITLSIQGRRNKVKSFILASVFHRVLYVMNFGSQENFFTTVYQKAQTLDAKIRLIEILPADIPGLYLKWNTLHSEAMNQSITKLNELTLTKRPPPEFIPVVRNVYICFNALSEHSKYTLQHDKKGQFGDLSVRRKVLQMILTVVGRYDPKEFQGRIKEIHQFFKYCFSILNLVVYDFEHHQLQRLLEWLVTLLKNPQEARLITFQICIINFIKRASKCPSLMVDPNSSLFFQIYELLSQDEDILISFYAISCCYSLLSSITEDEFKNLPVDNIKNYFKKVIALEPTNEYEYLLEKNKEMRIDYRVDDKVRDEAKVMIELLKKLKEKERASGGKAMMNQIDLAMHNIELVVKLIPNKTTSNNSKSG